MICGIYTQNERTDINKVPLLGDIPVLGNLFKKGGFVMAIKAQVPVLPVAVEGGTASMRKGSLVVRPATVSVRIGAPIETRGMDLGDRQRLADLVRDQVEALLTRSRRSG